MKEGTAIVPHPVDIHVGRRMRQQRELCGLTQVELARQLGLSFQQVQKYETGANRISSSRMWQVCEMLDVTPGYFFEGLEGKKQRGRRPGGIAEESQDGRSARQVLVLNKAFKQVDDTRVRRQVVQLVKSLARS